jgi:hypothetical protein
MEGKYVIDIVTEEDEVSLLDEIKNLKPIISKSVIEEEPVSISSIIKSNKKEKKNKKKGNLSKLAGFVEEDIDDEDLNIDIDALDLFKEFDDGEISDRIVDKQKRNYNKLKKEENVYKKEFAEEITLLYNLLAETSEFSNDLEKQYKELTKQKTRGVSKYSTDLAQTALTAKSNRLAILKEITNIKKTIADLNIKSEAKSKNVDVDSSPEKLASSYLKGVLDYGRSDFIKSSTNNNFSDSILEDKLFNLRSSGLYENNITSDMLEDRLDELYEDDENKEYRSNEANKYIEYEHLDVQIYVMKCIDTGELERIVQNT